MTQNLDENSAPIFSNEVNQPYARRSVGAFFWIVGIITVGAFFAGWSLTASQGPESIVEKAVPDELGETVGDAATDMNIDSGAGSAGAGEPIIIPDGEPLLQTAEPSLREYFDGKILDFEGNVAGNISAVEHNEGDIQSFTFVLDDALTPEGEAREYVIPRDEVKVVQEGGAFYIQLTKLQTEALAAQLYDGPDR